MFRMTTYLGLAIGIDIGTSQCSVAAWTIEGTKLLKSTRNIERTDDVRTLEVEKFFHMKRLIGRADSEPLVSASEDLPFMVQNFKVGVRPFTAELVGNKWRYTTPEAALTTYLKDLRCLAQSELKLPIDRVMFTVPVSFSRVQIFLIERACYHAGFNDVNWMPEPAAVAMWFALERKLVCHEEEVALIFNMGAGFCDVAITACEAGNSHVKALAGSAIGGEDLLQNMMGYLWNIFKNHGVKEMGFLRVATQDAIHKLSFETSVQVDIDLGGGVMVCKTVKREEFEEVNQHLFDRCQSLVIQCLNEAQIQAEEVNHVIVVGGCSYIPRVQRLVTDIFNGKELYKEINPLEDAVRGAVVQALNFHLDIDTLFLVTQFDIGIRVDGDIFVPIILRNTSIPVQKELTFTTIDDDQTEAAILVYEGERKNNDENHFLGYFKITGIPPAIKGVPRVNVRMEIDIKNVLRVLTGVVMPPEFGHPAIPEMEVRMPTVDVGHGCCVEALERSCGATLILVPEEGRVLVPEEGRVLAPEESME